MIEIREMDVVDVELTEPVFYDDETGVVGYPWVSRTLIIKTQTGESRIDLASGKGGRDRLANLMLAERAK